MVALLLGCLLLAPSLAILLPNHKNSVPTVNILADPLPSPGVTDGSQNGENSGIVEMHSKPMILPAIQTFDSNINGGTDQAAVGPSVILPMIMVPSNAPSDRMNSAQMKLAQFFTPDAFTKPNRANLAVLQGTSTEKTVGKVEELIAPGNDKSVRLPSYHLTEPQISPPESIVNPFIPPVAIKKNQQSNNELHILPLPTNMAVEKPKLQQSPPVAAPPQTKKNDASRPQFNTNLLAGSPVMKLLSNLSSDCQQSFSSLAKSVNSLTIADFKQKFYSWAAGCDKEDIVEDLENRTETAREAVRANMTKLIQALPLYLMPLQTLEKNESLTVAEKSQAVKDYMASIPDPNIVKTITFLNQLFVGEMIPQFLPSLGKQSKTSQRLKPVHPKNTQKSKRSVDESSSEEEELLFNIAETHHL